ncbi:MAG: hypothetical protein JXB10_17115 [Pirellulales bacterium]|nr:hypothetical protein [Pirellulales bacterium]
MWRSLFLAIGVFAILLGAQCLGVAKFTMKMRNDPVLPSSPFETIKPGAKKQINPAPWAPWSLLATGTVVCLYSFTLPRRITSG